MSGKVASCRFISGCLFLLVSGALGTANSESNKKALNQVLKRIEATTDIVRNLKVQKNVLLKELATVEKAYGEIAEGVKQLQTAAAKNQEDLLKINQKVLESKKAIKKIAGQLEGQIRAAYAMGRMKRLKMLLNQQNSVRTNRIMVYYDFLNRERLDKLELAKSMLKDLHDLENEGNATKRKLIQLAEEKKQEQANLSSIKLARTKLLKTLKEQQLTKAEELEQLKKKEAELRRLIASLLQEDTDDMPDDGLQKSFLQLKGTLEWPLRGRLKKRFGSKRAGGLWDGVLIDAEEGADVSAVTRGRIVYSDWLKGYGLLVIIDHGKGYMTLYAFNQSLYKEVGDRVNQGDIIASVGKSDGRSEAGLYFGIRKKGKPLNPLKWCRKPQQGKVG